MLKIILSLSLLLVSQVALAAIPPMSKEMRERQASHIVEGRVLKVEKELVNARGEDQEFKDWHFTALVEISQFIKGEELAEISVRYWKPAQRPRGWTGPQGQNRLIIEGDEVRLFMSKEADSDSYHLLMPNGWESLSETQMNSMDEEDDLDDNLAEEFEI